MMERKLLHDINSDTDHARGKHPQYILTPSEKAIAKQLQLLSDRIAKLEHSWQDE